MFRVIRRRKKRLAIRKKIDTLYHVRFLMDREMEFSIHRGDEGSRLGRVAAPNKLTLREILHLYFSETVYYGRMSCRCATAACPLRMPSPCPMPVRQRDLGRPASPGYRSRVDPNARRSRAGTMPPIATHAFFSYFRQVRIELENRGLKHVICEPHRVFHLPLRFAIQYRDWILSCYALKTNDLATHSFSRYENFIRINNWQRNQWSASDTSQMFCTLSIRITRQNLHLNY